MVADALESERLIGMVMLRPGWEPHYEEAPDVYPVGCAGFITHADRLPDGRFNIMLRGLEKFRILGERTAREGVERYRIARIESIEEVKSGATAAMSRGAAPAGDGCIARKLHEDTTTTSSRRTCPTPISSTRSRSISNRSRSRRCSNATACSSGAKHWSSCSKCA